MLTQILALLSETLERGDVDPDSSLPALGIDSISAMMLQERVRDLTGIEVPIVRFFEDTPVRELVSFLKSRPAPGARDRAKPAGPAEGAARMEEGEL
jgi:acyl carrier protein